MKRKTYERLNGRWEFRKPISQRSMKELNEDIAWCKDLVELPNRGFIKDYLAQLLTERTKRYTN